MRLYRPIFAYNLLLDEENIPEDFKDDSFLLDNEN